MSYGTGTFDGTGHLSTYATNWPSSGDVPGNAAERPIGQAGMGTPRRDTESAMLRARPGVFGALLENWLPFTAWVMDRFIGPRQAARAWQSPFDLGVGIAIQRQGPFPSADRPFPYPYEIGAVSGFMPMLDQYSISWAWGKTPSGPGVLTPIPVPFQATYPTLQKQTG